MSADDTNGEAPGRPAWRTQRGSARALLLVALGECVWRRHDEVWSSALVEALEALDCSPNATRKAMYRSADRGTIEAVRHGRRTAWRITPRGDEMLSEGTQRVFYFRPAQDAWTGNWLVLTLTIPETRRHLRHHLRTRLTWAGMGSPMPGLWITPRTDQERTIADILEDLEMVDVAYAFRGRLSSIGDERQMVAAAWDVDELAAEYGDFIQTYAEAEPEDDAEVFRTYIKMIQAYRRCAYLDPGLPREHLPEGWIGIEAADLLVNRRQAWRQTAQVFFDRLQMQG